jgi:ADP-sugar diphosphatase
MARWARSIHPSLTFRRIEVQSLDAVVCAGQERVLFIKAKADVVDASGKAVPGIVFLRGDSVAILIVLRTRKGDYAALVESAMPAIGKASYVQLPAGMMDEESDARQVAAREMEEETGLRPPSAEGLMDLGKVYPSPGACDESIRLFACEIRSSERHIASLQGRATGLEHENERLRLKIVRLDSLCSSTEDAKAHSAYLMYATLKKKGNL